MKVGHLRIFLRDHRRLLVFTLFFAAFSCIAAEKEYAVSIKGGKLTQDARLMKVSKGDQVRWIIQSDADGELHIHAYHIDLEIKSNKPKIYSFVANTAGRFKVEWHPEAERGQGIHHADPLALLEVYPK